MKKKKIIKLLFAVIFFLSGTAIFIYPKISDSIYKNKVKTLEEDFINNTENMNDDTINNQRLNELYEVLKEENNKLYESKQSRFLKDKIYEVPDINLSDYGLNDNIFGFLQIPAIDITLPIYLGSSRANMNLGATHLTGTSYPIGGVNTNSVIAAHRGFYQTDMFRHIDKIKLGDTLYIRNFMDTLEYKAVRIDVIKPNELNKLLIEENKDMVTIISCHPYRHNYLRYVVYFERK